MSLESAKRDSELTSRWQMLLRWSRSHPILLAGLLIAFVIGGSWAGVHYYGEYHRREAERALARYDFETAEQHLSACLRVHPNRVPLHLEMARAARRADHYETASEHLRICRERENKNPDLALESLLWKAQTGNLNDVEKLLQQEVDAGNPDADLILEAMAKGYIQIYRLDAAMYCLNRLLRNDPDQVAALMLRASLWNTAGNQAKAEADYRRAVEVQPAHFTARLKLGEHLLVTKQPEEALRQFEYLRQLPDGGTKEVLLGLARCRRQVGQLEAARDLLTEILAANPHDGLALLERGKIALEIESPQDAERWLRQAVADYPYDAQSNYLLAQALEKQNKQDEARPYEMARKRIEADWKALEEAFHQVVKNPRAPEPRLQAGLICLRNGREDEGERWLLSAWEQNPQHAPTRDALADLYERSGKSELANRYRRTDGSLHNDSRASAPVSRTP